MKILNTLLLLLLSFSVMAQKHIDKPFKQDFADKYKMNESIQNTKIQKVRSDRNKSIYMLSDMGVLHASGNTITKNTYYRPFENMNILDLDIHEGQFVYLSDIEVLSNAWAGKILVAHKMKKPVCFKMSSEFSVLIAGTGEIVFFKNGIESWRHKEKNFNPIEIVDDKKASRFLILADNGVYELLKTNNTFTKVYDIKEASSMALHQAQLVLGTSNGLVSLDATSFEVSNKNQNLPNNEITSLENIDGALWFGSKNGAFKLREDGKYDYYASKRWLPDNEVTDIAEGPENSVLVLTKSGLSKINFVDMTLAEKADYFQEIQRARHIRYGFTGNLSLTRPGDLTSGVMHDTDNDGLWTSMYLAAELFRYAVTKSEDAKLNAYEAFEAMERLTDISGVKGFPARAFERTGVELGEGTNGFSPERLEAFLKENGSTWQPDESKKWKAKITTSSDESCGHFFVYALFAELAPDKAWRDRAIRQIVLQMDHIIDNNWRLVTWNGKPTRWGNWSPEYVNGFPINVGDRRLNSTLVLAFLQTAYHFTGDEKYKEKAYELIDEHGYDENANRPASVIGFVEGEELSSTWNHSDDQMYFLTIPAFVKYSFTKDQKDKHFEAARSHWDIERSEKNPVWNFIYGLTGGTEYDLEESIWWLQEFPLDLVTWTIDNSERKDLEKLEPNFRRQQFSEVLPPDERPVHFHNGAYRNNSKGAGRSEVAPYIWLLPYWTGRYIDAISSAE
jgi:hypothetical protein